MRASSDLTANQSAWLSHSNNQSNGFTHYRCTVRDTPCKTLASKDIGCNYGHVKPIPVLCWVENLKPSGLTKVLRGFE